MRYRSEIDGLRAIAVLPVVLFHAGIDTFSGGYVGVDVFFVISGYLITSIILGDIASGRFRLLDFYQRRARRILPALLLVVMACIPAAWFLLPANDMRIFAQSIIAAALFGSNIFFWYESGYFANESELEPLLHTWSLGVEGQFYILFPVLFLFIRRVGDDVLILILIFLALCSLAAAHWGSFFYPNATFYLLPTRMWELLAGSLVALFLQKYALRTSASLNNLLSMAGLAAIAFAVFAFDDSTPFPSLYALFPVTGAALVIAFATPGSWVYSVLSSRLLVGIGLISYSLYLWHFPIFAFFRHNHGLNIDIYWFFMLIFVAFSASILTFYLVEKPFRSRFIFGSTRPFTTLAASITLILVAVGFWGDSTNGFAKPASNLELSVDEPLIDSTLAVLGDSHAEHLISGLSVLNQGEIIQRTSDGCIPFRNVDRFDRNFVPGACATHTNAALDELLAVSFDGTVILSSMGPVYLTDIPFKGQGRARVRGQGVVLVDDPGVTDRWEIFETGLRNTLAELSQIKDVRIVVALDVPELGIRHGCNRLSKSVDLWLFELERDFGDVATYCRITREEYDQRTEEYRNLVFDITAEFDKARVFDPSEIFCDSDYCYGYLPDWGYLYRDADHLSHNGSLFFASGMASLLNEIEAVRSAPGSLAIDGQ